MIKTILLLLLGFFIAGFVALLLAPILWRRAVRLTTKRIEASMPLSANELEAEKDRLRASHAMAARRLEMNIENLNHKTSAQLVELSRMSEEARRLSEERAAQERLIARLKGEVERQAKALDEKAEAIASLEARLDETLAELETRSAGLLQLNDTYEEERLLASSRQIELVARETELRKVEGDLALLRRERKEAIREARDAETARDQAEAGLKVAEKRNADLQKKLEGQMRVLYELEEKLERREGEIARLRQDITNASTESLSTQAARRLREAEEERDRLARELADKSLQLGTVLSEGGVRRSTPAQDFRAQGFPAQDFNDERETLQTRISRLMQENKKLRADLSAQKAKTAGGAKQKAPADTARADDALREQIHSLAAEVVSLTAALEGTDTPITRLLEKAEPEGAEGRPLSLAERVRALRAQTKG
ncbi:hypothetical protein JYP46_12655 [Nitratireductor aquimarinus]|uniref:hypothetical protein n=1 Tax=Alphaproteobacteria TaxID=28211 RepID=UPI0019D3AAFA|nr:hypothetical protein [Tritonibacter mobilis]MBN7757672.1 hypothetical protein [Nitratireductor aquimarinus]MBY6000433.1 hypothetical protein [Tritonibacter mobilis]MBY6022463.1 hypothetical protein [Nitratireductor sp. DP7N14-4]